jgi:hypothetical protein
MTEQWAISKGQQRIVVALVRQREEVVAKANETLAEIGEGLQEALAIVATARGLDAKDVEFADGATPGEIILRKKAAPAPTAEAK